MVAANSNNIADYNEFLNLEIESYYYYFKIEIESYLKIVINENF